MSRGFVKDGDREDVPLVTPRVFLPEGTDNYVTPEGMAALLSERRSLNDQKAVLPGDEADNRVARNFLNCKLTALEHRISSAVVVRKGSCRTQRRGDS